jgi:hypothetical protein
MPTDPDRLLELFGEALKQGSTDERAAYLTAACSLPRQ